MAVLKAQRSFDFRKRRKDGKLAKRPGRKAPPKGKRVVPHRVRPEVEARFPVHVVMKVATEVGRLRKRKVYHAVRRALRGCLARVDYRVVHISIQNTHLHVLVEAENKQALTRGMQGFAISAAKWINRAMGRTRGTVFPKRYHATYITTPTQARNELAYVLNNWLKHRANVGEPYRIDPFSSAWQFTGWKTPHGYDAPKEPLPVAAAQSWLLREGWRRAKAGAIGLDEIPRPS